MLTSHLTKHYYMSSPSPRNTWRFRTKKKKNKTADLAPLSQVETQQKCGSVLTEAVPISHVCTETHEAALLSQAHVERMQLPQSRTRCTYVWITHHHNSEPALAAHTVGERPTKSAEQRKTKEDVLCGPSHKSPQTNNTVLGRMEVRQYSSP